jgi:LPXTG-motif cell wall-anchored protein
VRNTLSLVTRLAGVLAVLLAAVVVLAGPAGAQDETLYRQVPVTFPQQPGNPMGPGTPLQVLDTPPRPGLADTGSDALPLVAVAGGAILAGGVLVAWTRRRTSLSAA